MTPIRYPVVLFDIGETLVGPRLSFGSVYGGVLRGMGLEIEDDRLEGCIRETSSEMKRRIPVGTDRFSFFPDGEDGYWLRFFEKVLDRAGVDSIDAGLPRSALEKVRQAFKHRSAWEVYPDVVPMLESLRDMGTRMGVVSNWDSRLPSLLATLELDRFFETVGVSQREGIEKPDPEFFLRVLRRLEARPEQALHVGNVPELDAEGARAAGIDALLVDRRRVLERDHGALRDLSDLPRRISRPPG